MSIVRWNPSRELDQFFNRFVDQSSNGWGENIATSDWNPVVDIRETDEDYQIDLEVPAVQPSDVKVTFKDGVLEVTGERKYEKETTGKVHRVEHHYVDLRVVPIAGERRQGRIEANAKDGVLYLKVPKRPEVKPRAIEVNVK